MTREVYPAGIHDLPVETYYDDPCVEPSLNSSGIRTLLEQTPAHFKAKNSRLTDYPDFATVSTREMDLGTIIHGLILGKGQQVDICEFDDWRTKAAQQQREFSRSQGRIPVIRRVYNEAFDIAERAEQALSKRFGSWPIGKSEQTIIWQRDTAVGRIWCRALIDHLFEPILLDIKTTGKSISDEELAKKLAGDGADLQAAWYTEGLETVMPQLAGRVQFIFAVLEVEPPYAIRFVTLSESWLTRARMRIARAAITFAACLRQDNWPGWPATASLSAPTWLESRWTNAELEETT